VIMCFVLLAGSLFIISFCVLLAKACISCWVSFVVFDGFDMLLCVGFVGEGFYSLVLAVCREFVHD
jgi:hypothetical protein